MAGRLEGKVAIVTGAAGGIGAATVRRLAADGARVAIADLDQGRAAELAKSIGDQALPLVCNVADETAVATCVAATVEHFGRLDVVVNNAGLMTFKSLGDWTADDWHKVLAVDLVGAAMFVREAFRHMTGGGALVNVASVHAERTTASCAPYSAAKAAMLSLTRTAAIEGKARQIRANAVLPGAVDTPMLWENPNLKSGAEKIERADVGQPEDIAAAIAFLASDDARFITGAALAVDGGRLAQL
jgi:NAD(P)-dependent dehydrogenase (short-subunit alcohol dehydrogenase family)